MTITQRDVCIIRLIARYYVLNRVQIQRLCFPTDSTGRVTRRRLNLLVKLGFVNRHRVLVHHPFSAPPGSIYYPAKKGCELLAEYYDDETFLLTPTRQPETHHVLHWLAVSDTHIKLDEAIDRQPKEAEARVSLDGWINEWDIVNKDESAPEKRYCLYTVLRESPRLICAPDAAFMLTVQGFSKVFYVEQDQGTTGARQVAARKCQGYAQLAEAGLHVRHFPQANVPEFSVLCITIGDRRRDALRKAFREKPGAKYWKFASVSDLMAETFLHASVFYGAGNDEVFSLVKP